ncbi:MAG: hypothetical protein JRI59_08750 [Deltaproteobacteria bacterium]|nr:hypothetical protein [Deltaproteobacteria bacterium]
MPGPSARCGVTQITAVDGRGRLGPPLSRRESPIPRIIAATTQARGKKSEAAKILGVTRVTLWKWLKDHHFTVEHVVQANSQRSCVLGG